MERGEDGFSVRHAAEVIGVPPGRVREWIRAGLITPSGRGGEDVRFEFQDLVVLRTLARLEAEAPAQRRRVRRAVRRLSAQLPPGHRLSAMHLETDGARVLVHEGNARIEVESGQAVLPLEEAVAPAAEVAPLPRRPRDPEPATADEWHDRGRVLEASAPLAAREAYRRAIAIDPGHFDARVDLGHSLHEEGRVEEALAEYQAAVAARPGDAIARFNLGVALQDLGRAEEARQAYLAALELDPDSADAHYNLYTLCRDAGDLQGALRHFARYRALVRSR